MTARTYPWWSLPGYTGEKDPDSMQDCRRFRILCDFYFQFVHEIIFLTFHEINIAIRSRI